MNLSFEKIIRFGYRSDSTSTLLVFDRPGRYPALYVDVMDEKVEYYERCNDVLFIHSQHRMKLISRNTAETG